MRKIFSHHSGFPFRDVISDWGWETFLRVKIPINHHLRSVVNFLYIKQIYYRNMAIRQSPRLPKISLLWLIRALQIGIVSLPSDRILFSNIAALGRNKFSVLYLISETKYRIQKFIIQTTLYTSWSDSITKRISSFRGKCLKPQCSNVWIILQGAELKPRVLSLNIIIIPGLSMLELARFLLSFKIQIPPT